MKEGDFVVGWTMRGIEIVGRFVKYSNCGCYIGGKKIGGSRSNVWYCVHVSKSTISKLLYL
jgi:hypothetical protein